LTKSVFCQNLPSVRSEKQQNHPRRTILIQQLPPQPTATPGASDSPSADDQSTSSVILALIKGGNWAAGQKLPSQRQLAQRLGVSRPTVREALVALETMGHVRILPGKGIYLAGPSPETPAAGDCQAQQPARLVQMYQFRYVVEPAVAGLVAKNATAAQIEDLKHLVDRMRDTLQDFDPPLLARLNCAFHQQLVEAANNPFFTQSLAPSLTLMMEHQQPASVAPEAVVAEHETLLAALMARSTVKARRAMRRHIEASAARVHITVNLAE